MKLSFPKYLGVKQSISPWIVLGTTAILLVIVVVMAIQNTSRERRYMSEILSAKGVALIRAVEAGTRTGMMGMRWGGRHVQRLLEETARLPDVLYMAVVDPSGNTVAHSDPEKIGTAFGQNSKLGHLGPDLQERWELVQYNNHERAFEIHRHFRPLQPWKKRGPGHRPPMRYQQEMMGATTNDWFLPDKQQRLLIVAGLDITPFEEAIANHIRTTVVLSAILVLLGFGALVSLFWMHSYRTAKRSLRDTSAFANEVVTHLPVGLVATDAAGRITFFNAAAASITKTEISKAKGQTLASVLPADLCDIQNNLLDGGAIVEKEMACAFADGQISPVSISATRIINEVGDFVGQVLILRDLGEVRRLQDAIRRQEKLAAIGGMAAGVAHEIRNPLSSIKGLAAYFADQFSQGSDAREAAGVMIQEVDRLNRAITELLTLAGPTDLKRQKVDLASLVTRSIQLIQTDATNQDIDIQLKLVESLCAVWIDPDRLAQCLLNLYLNAIEAMDRGGELTVSCRQIDDDVQVVVADTGEGIAPEAVHKIFDPYFTTKNKGTGLGLAIVHKIIEAHQAHLEVTSVPGEGTEMVIHIPCHDDISTKARP